MKWQVMLALGGQYKLAGLSYPRMGTVPLTYSFTRYANEIRTIVDRYTNVIPYTYDSAIQYDIG